MSNWERRAKASTGEQVEEESTGGEDGQCDLEDELDYCGCCLCTRSGSLLEVVLDKV
jgi:hypothetical protein